MCAEAANAARTPARTDPEDRPAGSADPDRWVLVGRVARAHGLAGALGVTLYGEETRNLGASDSLRLSLRGRTAMFSLQRLAEVPSARDGRARARIWLDGISTRDEAELWTGAEVGIPEDAIAALPAGEYYWRDLIGLRCFTVDGDCLGRIEEIWPTGSNDVLVVREGTQTILIPALYEVLTQVDLQAGLVRVDPPEGLVDPEGSDAA